jgi:hypothetical protein
MSSQPVACAVQAAPGQLGSAALELVQSTMPVFDAPWRLKEALEAAGVSQLTSTTPARIRLALCPTPSPSMQGPPDAYTLEAAMLLLQ